jgi:hypothetical protein
VAKVGERGFGRGRQAEIVGRGIGGMKREGGSWREVDRVGGKGVRNRWAGLGGGGYR